MRILLQKQVYPDCASCSADFAAFAFWVKNGWSVYSAESLRDYYVKDGIHRC